MRNFFRVVFYGFGAWLLARLGLWGRVWLVGLAIAAMITFSLHSWARVATRATAPRGTR